MTSRPAWARGLKPFTLTIDSGTLTSRPAWARGLKHLKAKKLRLIIESRPAWARGLKQEVTLTLALADRRALRGRVD